jgi:cobalt/nickel transport system permease protein
VLIGIGEALITGVVVSSVIAARPDLVHGARRALSAQRLVVRDGEVPA